MVVSAAMTTVAVVSVRRLRYPAIPSSSRGRDDTPPFGSMHRDEDTGHTKQREHRRTDHVAERVGHPIFRPSGTPLVSRSKTPTSVPLQTSPMPANASRTESTFQSSSTWTSNGLPSISSCG